MVQKNWLIAGGLLFASTCRLTAAEGSSVGFGAAVNYAVGPNPQALVSADFNNDGHLDLATVNLDSGTVSVLLGDGRGGLGAAINSDAGSIPGANRISLAIADFNNDGKIDLAVVSADVDYASMQINSGWVSVLLGNGNGTFQAPKYPVHFMVPLSVAVGDVNNDGKSDLVLNEATGDALEFGYVEAVLGDGHGGFAHEGFGVGLFSSPRGTLTVADLNRDGKLDAIVDSSLWGGSAGYALMGKGDGTFSYDLLKAEFYTGYDVRALAAGDFTGDGFPDLISTGWTVDVARGRGDGNGFFDRPISQTANGALHTGVAVADFNGDGKLDAVTSDADTGTVSLMLGNGNGTLGYIGAFAVGLSPAAVTVGDFNGDGRADVATANGGSNNVSVLLNQSSLCTSFVAPDLDRDCDVDAQDVAAFVACASRASVPVSAACRSSDFDGDGDADMSDFGLLQRCYGNAVPNCAN